MRINEVIVEDQIDEASPMGFFARAGHKLGAAVGLGSSAAKLDVGKRANELSKSFVAWALRSGIDTKNTPVGSIKQFLQQQGLPAPQFSQTSYNLSDKNQNTKVWTSIAQAAFRYGGATQGSVPLGQQYGVAPGQFRSPGGQSVSQLIRMLQSQSSTMTPQQRQRLQNLLVGAP